MESGMYKEVLALLAQSKIVTTLILHLFVQDAVQSAMEDPDVQNMLHQLSREHKAFFVVIPYSFQIT